MPRLPSTRAHSMPAGPGADTSTSFSAVRGLLELARGATRVGTPRRWSAFWVHQIGPAPISHRETQTLQPMHSRMSSKRPSSIFFGRNGSAIDGRAAPMMSHCPDVMASTITSGSVNRPTLTHGLVDTVLAIRVYSASWLVSKKRDEPASSPQLRVPMLRSQ